jgi:16S rRNA (cytosine967-C5)-methyltransferase
MNFLLGAIVQIIKQYKGEEPLSVYLKSYFKRHPKLGSRDRRSISEAVYIYYRCAAFFPDDHPIPDIINEGVTLCNSKNEFLKSTLVRQGFGEQDHHNFACEKRGLFQESANAFSAGLSPGLWLGAMLQQPNLFLRLRADKEKVFSLLDEALISYSSHDMNVFQDEDKAFYDHKGTCIGLENSSKMNSLLPPEVYVVQDYSSQVSMAAFTKFAAGYKNQKQTSSKYSVWDVCAGAGGKSIFWKDKFPEDQIQATDIRESILKNLEERFALYGINEGLETLVLDVSQKEMLQEKMHGHSFDFIICDVPCSGSGTWARTPEQFYFFKEKSLRKFEKLQFQIAFEAQRFLKENGLMAYITCSVFKAENETVVEKLLQNTSLELLHQQLINGIPNHSDSLFIAIFRRIDG